MKITIILTMSLLALLIACAAIIPSGIVFLGSTTLGSILIVLLAVMILKDENIDPADTMMELED